jgi:hypothetical protein
MYFHEISVRLSALVVAIAAIVSFASDYDTFGQLIAWSGTGFCLALAWHKFHRWMAASS